MSFISTLAIMQAMKTFLAALPLVDGAPDVKLFDKVEFYSMPNLVKGLEELRLFKKRICLIIPSGDDFENELQGGDLHCEATYDFELLIADRNYGKRQDAATGDDVGPNTNPGVVAMKDIVVEKLFGQSLGFLPRRLNLRPVGGQALLLTAKERDDASGREAWQMTWSADAGDRVAKTR